MHEKTAEGLIDHHLLGLHHVRPGPDEFIYDVGFLAWGVAMLVIGAGIVRAAGGRYVRVDRHRG